MVRACITCKTAKPAKLLNRSRRKLRACILVVLNVLKIGLDGPTDWTVNRPQNWFGSIQKTGCDEPDENRLNRVLSESSDTFL